MAKEKGTPIRTCIATRVKKPKKELIRIVHNPQSNKLEIDLKGKLRTRGANLDASLEAFDIMVKKNVLKYALKLDKTPTTEEYADLRNQFINALQERNFRPDNKPVKLRITREDLMKIEGE